MWAAVLVALPRWSGAFIAADTAVMPPLVDQALHLLNLAAGFGMAVIEVLGTAYLLDAWGRMKPRKTWNAKSLDHRWKVLTFFVAGLFLMTPLILGPWAYVRMNGQGLGSLPHWFQGLWAVAVVLSPAFIIGGVAVADQGLLTAPSQQPASTSGRTAGREPAQASSADRSEPAPTKPEPAQSQHKCQRCGREFETIQAVNAHQRFCQVTAVAAGSNGRHSEGEYA